MKTLDEYRGLVEKYGDEGIKDALRQVGFSDKDIIELAGATIHATANQKTSLPKHTAFTLILGILIGRKAQEDLTNETIAR